MAKKKRWRAWAVSRTGWYVAIMLERFEYDDEDKSNPNRRCLAWENVRLFKADDPEEAYAKAVRWGRMPSSRCVDTKGRKGRWKFVGIKDLLPVYDPFEDGAEILWITHENRSVRSIQRMALKKHELPVFTEGRE